MSNGDFDFSNLDFGNVCDTSTYGCVAEMWQPGGVTDTGTPYTYYGPGGTTSPGDTPTAGTCGAGYTYSPDIQGGGGQYGSPGSCGAGDTAGGGNTAGNLGAAAGAAGGLLGSILKGTSNTATQSMGGKTTSTPVLMPWASTIPGTNMGYSQILEQAGLGAAQQQPLSTQQQLYNTASNALTSSCGAGDLYAGMSPQQAQIASMYANLLQTGGLNPAINTAQQGYNTLQNAINACTQELQNYIQKNVPGLGNLVGRSGVADMTADEAVKQFQLQNAGQLAAQGNVVAGLQSQVPTLQQAGAAGLSPMIQSPANLATQEGILDYLNKWQQAQQTFGFGVANQGANLLNSLLPYGTSTQGTTAPTNVPSIWQNVAGLAAQPVAQGAAASVADLLGTSLPQTANPNINITYANPNTNANTAANQSILKMLGLA